MTFADKMKNERIALGLTQRDAAKMLKDVSLSWLQKAETLKRDPHPWLQAEAIRRYREYGEKQSCGSK